MSGKSSKRTPVLTELANAPAKDETALTMAQTGLPKDEAVKYRGSVVAARERAGDGNGRNLSGPPAGNVSPNGAATGPSKDPDQMAPREREAWNDTTSPEVWDQVAMNNGKKETKADIGGGASDERKRGDISRPIVDSSSEGSIAFSGERRGDISRPIVDSSSEGSIAFSGERRGDISQPIVGTEQNEERERRADLRGGDSGEATGNKEPVDGGLSTDAPVAGGPRVVVNPKVFEDGRDALCVAYNEAFRVLMEIMEFDPVAEPTDEQREFFSDTAYAGDENMMRRTIVARICTFDTSVRNPTDDQIEESVEFLHAVLKAGYPENEAEQSIVRRAIDVLGQTLSAPAAMPEEPAPEEPAPEEPAPEEPAP